MAESGTAAFGLLSGKADTEVGQPATLNEAPHQLLVQFLLRARLLSELVAGLGLR
jgi:hypothetical protein